MFGLFGNVDAADRRRHRERMAEIERQRQRDYRHPLAPAPRQPPMSWPWPDPNIEAWAKGQRAAELEHEKPDLEWIAARLDAIAGDLRAAYMDAVKHSEARAASFSSEYDYARIAIEALAQEVRDGKENIDL